ncbi:MAG: TRAP transporter small permease, partial [Alphaproteobacteria bacterium]
MRAILRAIDMVCAIGAGLAAAACLALAVMLIVEVISTSFLAWSQPWAVEYSGYLLAATLFAGAGWTLGQGGHVRVSVLIQLIPPRGQRIADLMATVFALGLAIFVDVYLVENAWRSHLRGSVSYYPSATPLWMPQAVLAFGWVVLALGLAGRAIRLLAGLAPEAGAPP